MNASELADKLSDKTMRDYIVFEYLPEIVSMLRKQQESIEGLNRDYDLLFAEHQLLLKKEWVGLMRGVRVEGDTLVITVKGGNDVARELCGDLIEEMNK